MTETTFRAMGTEWYVRIDGCASRTLPQVQAMVHREECRFSRFRPASALSRLNIERRLHDPVLASVVRRALRYQLWTQGAFDPAVGSAVITAGYDRTFEAIQPGRPPTADRSGNLEVRVRRGETTLSGTGNIDLGGIVKGWTVDLVARMLETAGADGYLVDGGGDIRVGGRPADTDKWSIGVADDYRVSLGSGAVATSSSLHRRWATESGQAHHIIAPVTGRPAEGPYVTAIVVARDAETADVLGTALIADADRALPAVTRFDADVMLQHADGRWLMTPGMERWLAQ
ncbi:MAG: FAD:protein FMN transferase [Dehalococcoidia bacterium]|nr:FAD:protein FMN transferase [Dehalococcoidia bacterium]